MKISLWLRLGCLLGGLACSSVVWAANQCPAGQQRVCLGSCFCAPGDSAVLNNASLMLGMALRNWIVQSRQHAVAADLSPIPPAIRAQLEGYFDAQLLDMVRYRVGDDMPASLSHALLQNQDVSAVTLVDLIVFQSAEDAQNNVPLWAHELTHVRQYRELGVDAFTARYARDYISLESPAYQMQSRVRYGMKQVKTKSAEVTED